MVKTTLIRGGGEVINVCFFKFKVTTQLKNVSVVNSFDHDLV